MNKFAISVLFILFMLIATPVVLAQTTDIERLQSIKVTDPIEKTEPQESENSLPYDFSSTISVPIQLEIIEEISTKEGVLEGQQIDFRVKKDVWYKGKTILKRGRLVQGTVETVITAGMNGFPAEIILGNFQIPNIKQSQLMDTYTKKGQNRCLWVYPLKWSLTLIPFVGSLTNLIMGGHAIIKTSDTITIYYYPEWK